MELNLSDSELEVMCRGLRCYAEDVTGRIAIGDANFAEIETLGAELHVIAQVGKRLEKLLADTPQEEKEYKKRQL